MTKKSKAKTTKRKPRSTKGMTYAPKKRSFAERVIAGRLADELRGRPSVYQPDYARQAAKLCSEHAATDRELATWFEVTQYTIWHWQNKFPEFRTACVRGKEAANDRVEQKLYEKAMGYSYASEKIFYDKDAGVVRADTVEHVPPSDTAMIFWLKNRRPEQWRDATHSSVDVKMLSFSATMSLDDKQATYRDILQTPPATLLKLVHTKKDDAA